MSAESMSEAIVLIVGLGGLLLWAFGDRLMNWVRLIWSVFVYTWRAIEQEAQQGKDHHRG